MGCLDESKWESAIEEIADRILWDRDWEMEDMFPYGAAILFIMDFVRIDKDYFKPYNGKNVNLTAVSVECKAILFKAGYLETLNGADKRYPDGGGSHLKLHRPGMPIAAMVVVSFSPERVDVPSDMKRRLSPAQTPTEWEILPCGI
ncbi:hypothetical protein HK104_009055 [Borealophlyctis nickersoniae]|nr:hypothetical protein HK104_009055 [Borealophlyctis nickersoniae]